MIVLKAFLFSVWMVSQIFFVSNYEKMKQSAWEKCDPDQKSENSSKMHPVYDDDHNIKSEKFLLFGQKKGQSNRRMKLFQVSIRSSDSFYSKVKTQRKVHDF